MFQPAGRGLYLDGLPGRAPQFFAYITPGFLNRIFAEFFFDVVKKYGRHVAVQIVDRTALFPNFVDRLQRLFRLSCFDGRLGPVTSRFHEVVTDAFHNAYTKISSGKNAETRKLGTSTSSLTLRSTATLQMA